MERFSEVLLDPSKIRLLTDDVTGLIDQRVQRVSGVSGMAIRAGYKVVSSLRGGRMVRTAVGVLLPDFVKALEPFVPADPDVSMVRDWTSRKSEIANALLAVTDAKAENASAVLARPYRKLRSFAEAQVAAAVPSLADVVLRCYEA